MRFLLATISIAVLSGIAELFLPWWIISVVAFVIAFLFRFRPGKSFLAGFCGIAIFWLTAALFCDIPNEHILSHRMAELFHLPGYLLFMLVTAVVGGLVGGMAAMAGSLTSGRSRASSPR